MAKSENIYNYTNIQAFLLVALRVLFGWYFLYEGITKIANPDWTSMGYLMDSKGAFAGMFHSMASDPGLVAVVDWLNMWGLTLIRAGYSPRFADPVFDIPRHIVACAVLFVSSCPR